VEALENLELVEDYGEKIRKTRQRMKMTVEDLGTKINEKVSVIKKLEKEELTPDRKLIQKIRNILKIELLIAEEAPSTLRPSKPSRGRTLGDIIKLSGDYEDASESEEA
jgi:putative transcription factor